MLSGQAYTFGKKARLALSLAWVGGFVDAVGFLELATYTSNQTGNTVMIGQRLAQRDWHAALAVYALVTTFLIGAMLAGVIIESARRAQARAALDPAARGRRIGVYTTALAIEAVLLLAAIAVAYDRPDSLLLMGLLPCLAMGLQNATITRISGSIVRTTHVTGVITDLGLEIVQFLYFLRDRARGGSLTGGIARVRQLSPGRVIRVSQRNPTVQRLLLLGGIWTSFLIGGILGVLAWRWTGGSGGAPTSLVTHSGMTALFIPVVFLVIIIVLEQLTPLATLDALHRAESDRAFIHFGLEPDLVPASIGLYRVGGNPPIPHRPPHTQSPPVPPRPGRTHRLPDLAELLLHAQATERVLVLAIESDIHIDANGLAGLEAAIVALRSARRELVVCAADSAMFLAISQSRAGRVLGVANLCSDVEFAVARAIDLLADLGDPGGAATLPA